MFRQVFFVSRAGFKSSSASAQKGKVELKPPFKSNIVKSNTEQLKSRSVNAIKRKTEFPVTNKNEVNLVGRLGTEPQLKTGENWQITYFSLATNRFTPVVTDGVLNGFNKLTDWHRIVLRHTLDSNIKKGDCVKITGSIVYNKYKPAWSEKQVTVANIVAKDVELVSKPGETKKTKQDESDDE